VTSCNTKPDINKVDKTTLHVIDSIKHYYPIAHKKELNIPFRIVNTGKNTLYIDSAETSGNCIIIKNSPGGPVKPGRETFFNLQYKSEGLFGYNKHYITFVANTYPHTRHTLVFDVIIVPDEFGYGDGFDYRYEPSYNKKGGIKEAVEGDETQQGYYVDSSELKYK